jgi:hypothetical protein
MSIVLSRPINYMAMEVIDFQDNNFGSDLEVQVTKIVDKTINKIYAEDKDFIGCSEVNELEKIIHRRLGLKVSIETNLLLAAILPFYSNKHHIFIHDLFKGDFLLPDQEKILKKSYNKKGYVDTAKAKVGGIFSEYSNHLFINFKKLITEYYLTAPEIVAVILHELGHAFYICEYSDRIESNNQILANIARNLFVDKNEKDMVFIYKELTKVNDKIKQEEVDRLVSGNRIIAGYTWFKIVLEANGVSGGSELLNKKYDETSFEQLADNFASRFGYGKQIILALEKIYSKDYFLIKSKAWIVFIEITEMITLVGALTIAIAALTHGSIPYGVFVALVIMIRFIQSGEAFKDYSYDELKIRYKRARNEYIEMIKNANLSKDEYKIAIENIYSIDKIIENTYQYRFLLNKLANVLINANKKAEDSIKEQQLLEELAHNDLFLKSAELKVI